MQVVENKAQMHFLIVAKGHNGRCSFPEISRELGRICRGGPGAKSRPVFGLLASCIFCSLQQPPKIEPESGISAPIEASKPRAFWDISRRTAPGGPIRPKRSTNHVRICASRSIGIDGVGSQPFERSEHP